MDNLERILQDAVDEACRGGADIYQDLSSGTTWEPQQRRIWTRLYVDDHAGISLERLRHWSEGYSSYSRKVQLLKTGGIGRFRKLVAEEIALVARLQRRDDEAIARTGSRYELTPSDLSCHPVGLSVALHSGLKLADMTCAHLEADGSGWRASQDSHDAISRAAVNGTNLRRVRIRGERLVFSQIAVPQMSYTDTVIAHGPVLTVQCELPDTALVALSAMKKPKLGQIVTHAALDGVEDSAVRRIVRTRLDGHAAIAIHLARVVAPLPDMKDES